MNQSFSEGLGAVHGLSEPIGAVCDTQHGLTNAVLLPYVIRANAVSCPDHIGERYVFAMLLKITVEKIFIYRCVFRCKMVAEALGLQRRGTDIKKENGKLCIDLRVMTSFAQFTFLFYAAGVEELLEWLTKFSEELGIPKTLGEIGVDGNTARLDEVTKIDH